MINIIKFFPSNASNFLKHSNNITLSKVKSYPLTNKIFFNYHMSYLMDSKYDDRFVKIDKRAFTLYKQAIISSQKFHEKKFIIVIIDCVKTKQKY